MDQPQGTAPASFQPGSTVSFRAAISSRQSYADGGMLGMGMLIAPSGNAPSPFDALNGPRLAGPQGSHPLANVDPRQLIGPATSGLEGAIELSGPVRVGEGISGRLRVRATRAINARGATLRLVGVRIREETRQRTEQKGQQQSFGTSHGTSSSQTTTTISWVEVHGEEIESLPFTEPALPAQLAAGQVLDLPFTLPAPRLGPPSAHAGSALIAWALEAHWDIGFGTDERVATLVHVHQHPDLLRAGVLTLGEGAMSDSFLDRDQGATISVDPLPPIPAGGAVTVSIAWPGAPGGRSARLELTADIKAAIGLSLVPVSVPVDHGALGNVQVTIPIPSDAPPTLETDGLAVGYRLRVIVDRKLRSDVTAERRIVIF